jgi:hypothetical protein
VSRLRSRDPRRDEFLEGCCFSEFWAFLLTPPVAALVHDSEKESDRGRNRRVACALGWSQSDVFVASRNSLVRVAWFASAPSPTRASARSSTTTPPEITQRSSSIPWFMSMSALKGSAPTSD